MSDRHYATDAKGAKQNKVTHEPGNEEEDPPPPYPGIPGADITSDTAPPCHPHVTQPRAPPLVSQPGYYPQLVPSAPHEDSSLHTGPQTSYEPHGPYYEGSHSDESLLIPPYPGQRRAAAPGSCTPARAHDGSYYPTYVHPVAMGPARPVPPARRNSDDCCDCNTCMLFTFVGCECLRVLLEASTSK